MLIRRVAVVSLGLTCLTVPLSLAGGGDADRIPSQVSLDDYHGDKDEAIFSGDVVSPRHACEKGRIVTVVGTDFDGSNPHRLGRDRTGGTGRYEVRKKIPFFADLAYAKAKRKRLRTGRVCKADRSEEISTAGRRGGQKVATKLTIIASRSNPDTETPGADRLEGRG
jgi:hypothetical protein